MRHTEFKRLKRDDQIELLYRNAVYIGKRKADACIIVLYQLDGFYVEIYYIKYRLHIAKLYTFTSVDLLEPYLQAMDVEVLINC